MPTASKIDYLILIKPPKLLSNFAFSFRYVVVGSKKKAPDLLDRAPVGLMVIL